MMILTIITGLIAAAFTLYILRPLIFAPSITKQHKRIETACEVAKLSAAQSKKVFWRIQQDWNDDKSYTYFKDCVDDKLDHYVENEVTWGHKPAS